MYICNLKIIEKSGFFKEEHVENINFVQRIDSAT